MDQKQLMQNELDELKKKETEEVKKVRTKYTELRKKIKEKYKPKKTKRKTIPKKVRIMVWNKYIGKEKGIGDCYCCGEEIHSMDFHVGHIVAVANGGSDKIDNLRPICSCCNKSMGTENMDEFKKRYMKVKVVKVDDTKTVKKPVKKVAKKTPKKVVDYGKVGNFDFYVMDNNDLRRLNTIIKNQLRNYGQQPKIIVSRGILENEYCILEKKTLGVNICKVRRNNNSGFGFNNQNINMFGQQSFANPLSVSLGLVYSHTCTMTHIYISNYLNIYCYEKSCSFDVESREKLKDDEYIKLFEQEENKIMNKVVENIGLSNIDQYTNNSIKLPDFMIEGIRGKNFNLTKLNSVKEYLFNLYKTTKMNKINVTKEKKTFNNVLLNKYV